MKDERQQRCMVFKRKRQQINKMQSKTKQDEEVVLTQRAESTLEKRCASGVVDTLRTEPWQHILDCDTARCPLGSGKYELPETLRELIDVDFEPLGLPLLLL